MKKLNFLLATASMCALVASCGQKPGYTIDGIVADATNGDSVFLQEIVGRELVNLDSTVIDNGTFKFKGVQDSTINCLLTWKTDDNTHRVRFYLQNGELKAKLSNDESSVTGTHINDVRQTVDTELADLAKKAQAIRESMSNSSLTEKELEDKKAELERFGEKQMDIIKTAIERNADNQYGLDLFKNNFYILSLADKENILSKISDKDAEDPGIKRISDQVSREKATAVGMKFTNFTMLDTEGKEVSLSDYVGNGKVTLIDFWASWCGPCRRAMPELVELYSQFKSKGFEIIGVSLDNNAEAWKNALTQMNMTWPQMSDLKGWQCEGATLYGVSSIPATVLVSPDGTILARNPSSEELHAEIEKALAK